MATKIVTKNSSTASSVPTAAQLVQGELAVNVADKRLYTEDNAGAVVLLADGTKLDGIEALADVTDVTNVTAAGALMDSELTSIASVKALNQGVATGDSPSFVGLTASGEITANGGIALGDNDKATFGANDDLQIYHTGSDSIIQDTGTGNLKLQGSDIRINNADSSKSYLSATDGGSAVVYHNGFAKIATTSIGIDVTGAVVATSLDISGNIDVDGVTNLDVVDIDGAVDMASTLQVDGAITTNADLNIITSSTCGFKVGDNGATAGALITAYQGSNNTNLRTLEIAAQVFNVKVGLPTGTASTTAFSIASDGSLSTPTLGTSNVRFGVNAGNSIVSGGNYNTVVGDEAGTAITTGQRNTAVGTWALASTTTGAYNTASGFQTMYANTTGGYNTASGYLALSANTTASNNTAVGYSSLGANTTGANNVAVGRETLLSNTTGALNTAVGSTALDANTTGGSNTAIGQAALGANTTASNNTAVGYVALTANTTGTQNAAVGSYCLDANTTGGNNAAFGHAALNSNTAASFNASFGAGSMATNTTGNNNTGLGYNALSANTTASNNTAVGYNSLFANTTGTKNVCIGSGAGDAITTGSNNTIIGDYAGTAALADTMVFAAGTTERFRVDSSGNLLVGTTTTLASTKVSIVSAGNGMSLVAGNGSVGSYMTNTSGTGNWSPFSFNNNGSSLSQIGSISCTTSTTAYNTSSDYRLKENVVPMSGSIDRLKALKPSRFNFIADPETTVDGFLAHEAAGVVAECATGTKDAMRDEEYEVTAAVDEVRDEDGNVTTEAVEAVTGTRSVPDYQGIDQSKLVPLLVSALQEAIARIETLEAGA